MHLKMDPGHKQQWSGVVLYLMSVSCHTGTAALQYESAACRLQAVLLYSLCTFVHSWALGHVVPFWSHPTHATKGYHQWCGCPQPLAPLVSPGGGLGPRCCATCASAPGDFPPWQSRRTLTGFSTSLQNNTCGRSKDASTEVCPTGAHCEQRPWLCAMAPEPPHVASREPRRSPSEHTHACKTLARRLAHRLPTFSSYLMLPHSGVLQASIHYLLPSPVPHEMDGSSTLHPYLPLAVCLFIV